MTFREPLTRTTLAALLLGSTGCSHVVGGHQQHALDNLKRKASFELNCGESELVLTPLEEPSATGWAFSYGVTGCGNKATYIQVPRHYKGAWFNNNTEADASVAAASEHERQQEQAAAASRAAAAVNAH
jgi:hypothetical protein